ncbi:hypothetical protein C4578_01865, partial [Candidatus Microgenomates bacterium]
NFFLWRFRNFVSFFALVIFWLAIYGVGENVFGYEKSQMITYLIGIAFLRSLVLASRSFEISRHIRRGELSRYLLWPLSINSFWFGRDLADKSINLIFAFFEIGLVILIFKLNLYFPQSPANWIFFIVLVLLSTLLYYFLSFCISILAFWTEDVWATRWLLGIIFLEFLSGAFFPLDILPGWLSRVVYFTPFPYLVFFPLKIWLGQVAIGESFRVLAITIFWLGLFYFLSSYLWKKGFRKYGAYGG